ncbi:MAG TPA: hypothetical protein VL337_08440 [Acidimicrobiales bacterium]|jgi:hypothetical protein|nr:hypothetical protein [Acidimicrobiales bacterium]
MAEISDDFMRDMLARSKGYSLVVLRDGPNRHAPGVQPALWEHGRRNFALRADGLLPVVCRVADDSGWAGVGIFDAPAAEVARLMDDDPAVREGVLVYEVHPVLGFPGDALP